MSILDHHVKLTQYQQARKILALQRLAKRISNRLSLSKAIYLYDRNTLHRQLDKIHQHLLQRLIALENEIILANLAYVHRMVTYYSHIQSIKDDLFTEGVLALYYSMYKFDLDRSDSFTAFATYNIRNMLRRCVYENTHIDTSSYRQTNEIFTSNYDSLDLMQEVISLSETPEDELINKDLQYQIEKRLRILNPSAVEFLKYRFGFVTDEEMTYAEISKLFNISKQRVHQVVSKSLMELSANLN